MAYNTRIAILTDSEVSELYSTPQFNEEQRNHYFHLDEHESGFISDRNDPLTNAYLILFLGYFRYKPLVLSPKLDEYRADLNFVRKKFQLHTTLPKKDLDSVPRSRLYAQVLTLVGFERYSEPAHDLPDHIAKVVTQTVEPRAIFDRCIDYLSDNRIAIPSYSKLQKLINAGIHREENQLQARVLELLSEDVLLKLDRMAYAEENKPMITLIKRLPKTFKPKEIHREIEVFNHIKDLMLPISQAIESLGLPGSKIQEFSHLLKFYTIKKLRALSRGAFCLYLICYLYQRYSQIADTLILALIFHVRRLQADAKSHAQQRLSEEMQGRKEQLKQASELVKLYISDEVEDRALRARAFSIMPRTEIPLVVNCLADVESDVKQYQWDYYETHHAAVKKCLRQIFLCLDFSTSDETVPLWRQVRTAQDQLSECGEMRSFDVRIAKRYRRYLYCQDPSKSSEISLAKAEMLLYIRVKESLESNQLFVPTSASYKCIDDDLVEPSRVDDIIASSSIVGLKSPVEELIAAKMALLERKRVGASRRLSEGQNKSVIFSENNGKPKWTVKRSAKDLEINNDFYRKAGQTHIAEIVNFTQRKTGFASAFTHIRFKDRQQPDISSAVACVIANGMRYGIHQMADLCELSYEDLRLIQKNFLRMETLHAANDWISNAISRLPIFKHYNIQEDLLHASYDGQKFESRSNTIRTRYSSKHFGQGKGLSALTLSANHVPANAKMMGLNEHESHHLHDILYSNTSDLQPDIVSTDTHGVNQVNFALLDLSGWQFAPRYAKPGKILADLFTCEESADGEIKIKLRRPINEKCIIEGSEFIKQVMATLHSKEASQATIVRKLSRFKRTNKQVQALIEYDRLIKCIYMLDFMDDENTRRYVQRALNRGEAYHQLQRRLEDVNGNKFRGNSDDEIDLWYECGRLIANCIIYFNSYLLSQMLEGYEKRNEVEKIELIKRCSPVAWTHINFNGHYSFAFTDEPLNVEELITQMMR